MAKIGLIATAAAWLNYRKAKAEYEEALSAFEIEKTALILGINEYNATKYNQLEEYTQRLLDPETGLPYNENDVVAGLKMIPILEVYNLRNFPGTDRGFVGEQAIKIGITNTTEQAFRIRKIGGAMYCYGKLAGQIGDLSQTREIIIESGETCVLDVNFGHKMNSWSDQYKMSQLEENLFTHEVKLINNIIIFNKEFDEKDYRGDVIKALKAASGSNQLVNGTIIQSVASKETTGYCENALMANFEIYYDDIMNQTVRRALYRNIQGYIAYISYAG